MQFKDKAVFTVYNDFLGLEERGSDLSLHPPVKHQRKLKLNDIKADIPAFPLPVVCVEQGSHRQDHVKCKA